MAKAKQFHDRKLLSHRSLDIVNASRKKLVVILAPFPIIVLMTQMLNDFSK